MSTLQVELGARSYPIHIEAGLLDRIAPLLTDQISEGRIGKRHAVIISDDHVAKHYLARVAAQCGRVFDNVDELVIPPGEKSKSIARLDELWQKLVELGADRKSTVVALGGGVVGDLAGFVAASFGRGVGFVQVPTSLLAQVDSSVGGKVGINLPTAKNMVGAFWQPKCVLIDPLVLETLNEFEFRSGMAEVIKYGVIMDETFFSFLESSSQKILAQDAPTMEQVILRCCELKAQVVIADEEERSGRRAILNYGHTYGHAIEAVTGYGQHSHGEAVAIGMNYAARLASFLGRVDSEFVQRQQSLLTTFNLPLECTGEVHIDVVAAMRRDKKVSEGTLMLVLPTRIGHVDLVPAPDPSVILENMS